MSFKSSNSRGDQKCSHKHDDEENASICSWRSHTEYIVKLNADGKPIGKPYPRMTPTNALLTRKERLGPKSDDRRWGRTVPQKGTSKRGVTAKRRARKPYDLDCIVASVAYIYLLKVRHPLYGGEYVGRAINYESRWNTHERALNKGASSKLLQAAWDRGLKVEFSILEVLRSPTPRELIAREQWHYDKRKPRFNRCRPG